MIRKIILVPRREPAKPVRSFAWIPSVAPVVTDQIPWSRRQRLSVTESDSPQYRRQGPKYRLNPGTIPQKTFAPIPWNRRPQETYYSQPVDVSARRLSPAVIPQVAPPANNFPIPWRHAPLRWDQLTADPYPYFESVRQKFGPIPGTIPSPVSPVPVGTDRRLIPRIPRTPLEENRLRNHTDKVADIFNSFFRAGYVRLTTVGEYQIVSGAFSQPRDPLPTDDVTVGCQPGNMFLNNVARTLFVCVVNNPGAALWLKLQTV